jgi:uncharacterized Tic20 family protein
MTDAQARQWAMFAHLSALAGGFLLGGLSFVGPLIIWLIKKDENPFVADQAREALNFNITVTIGFLISWVLVAAFFIGFLTMAVIGIAWLILTIMAGMAANNGQQYRYPWTLRLVT